MPRSFLLKRFSKPTGWMEGEKKLSIPEKGKQLEDTNNNPIKTREDSMQRWDATPEITSNILYVGMEWNKTLNQGIIDNPNKHDFIHHMIYRDIPNPTRLNDDETFKQLNKPESNKKPTYKCNQCGRVFKTKYTLTIHLKMPSHTGARPFVCAICGKGFRLSSTLCRHKIIHTSHKPHRCQTCGKAFNRSSTLKTHQRTHSDTKEFACDICNKGFHQKGNLRNHLLIHSGEKPYKCNLCKKAFNKLSNLKFHMHIHTDNKPYRCRYCKDSFSRRCELKGHISTCSHNATDKASIDANPAEL